MWVWVCVHAQHTQVCMLKKKEKSHVKQLLQQTVLFSKREKLTFGILIQLERIHTLELKWREEITLVFHSLFERLAVFTILQMPNTIKPPICNLRNYIYQSSEICFIINPFFISSNI